MEAFDGATALRDLAAREDDAAAARRIVARYLAVRYALRSGLDDVGEAGEPERASAAEYVDALGGPRAADRTALAAVLEAAARGNGPGLWSALRGAGASARRRGERSGARSCFRSAYELARAASDREAAAAAADDLASLASELGAPRAALRWRRRAALLRDGKRNA